MALQIPGYITTDEAAEQLTLKMARIRQLLADGTLKSEKVGNTRFVSVESVNAYKANRKPQGWTKGRKRKPTPQN